MSAVNRAAMPPCCEKAVRLQYVGDPTEPAGGQRTIVPGLIAGRLARLSCAEPSAGEVGEEVGEGRGKRGGGERLVGSRPVASLCFAVDCAA